MVYDALIMDCDNIFHADPMTTNFIRLDNLSIEDANVLTKFFAKSKYSIWLSPHEE